MALLAGLGCCAVAPASAEDKRPADVTITVVEDPEQLKEKINKIRLPDASEDSHAPQKSGNESRKNSNAADSQQHNEAAEGHHDAGGQQHHDATERHHDAAENAKSAAEAAKVDADDVRQQDGP